MRRPEPARRKAKWAGTVLTVLVVAAYIVGVRRDVFWTNGGRLFISLSSGCVGIVVWAGPAKLPGGGSFGSGPPSPVRWIPRYSGTTASGARVLDVPLWIPLLIVAAPTTLLWWRDLRGSRAAGCSECGALAGPGGEGLP